MINLLTIIFSLYAWVICAIAFSTHMAVVILATPFVKDRISFSIRCTRPIIRVALWMIGVTVRVENQEAIPKDHSFILVANHQSHVDILSFLLAVPCSFSFVAKKELLSVPIVGWDIKSQGHIAIDRKNPRQARRMLQALVDEIASNQKNLVIFAEGTRSATGALGEFKMGAFELAAKSQAMIIPAGISGTFHILNKNSLRVRPGKVVIRLGNAIPAPLSTKADDVEATRDAVVASIRALVN